MDTNRAIADSMTQSKAPFTMTITEYNKLTEEVKKYNASAVRFN